VAIKKYHYFAVKASTFQFKAPMVHMAVTVAITQQKITVITMTLSSLLL
jgi:hypothetical protein